MAIQTHTEDTDGAAPLLLIESFRRHGRSVRTVKIARRRGKQGYVLTGRWFEVMRKADIVEAQGDEIDPDDLPDDETPDDLARHTFRLAWDHARSHGTGYYRAILEDGKAKEIDAVAFEVTTGDDDQAEGAGSAEPVDLATLFKTAVGASKDHHNMHMATLEKCGTLMGDHTKMAEVLANAEIRKLEYRDKEKDRMWMYEMETMRTEASAKKWAAAAAPLTRVAEKLADAVGPVLVDRLRDMFGAFDARQSSGPEPSDDDGPSGLAAELDHCFGEASADAISKMREISSEKMIDLITAARAAATDYEFENIIGEFKKAAMHEAMRVKDPKIGQKFVEIFRADLSPETYDRLAACLKAGGLF